MNNFRSFYHQDQFSISIEVFPPKTEIAQKNLFEELNQIIKYQPKFFSVTYGAMGSTRNLTADLATAIYKRFDIPTAFHFTCVGTSQSHVKDYISHLKNEGLNLIVSLRGDLPPGEDSSFLASRDFSYANELVDYIHQLGDFSQAVAGYPEGHPESLSLEDDMINLKRKVDAGADIIITQLFFDNDHFYRFCERAHQHGIHVPIIPGIMPIVNLNQIKKITKMCGASIPEKLLNDLEKNSDDQDAIKKIGTEYAIHQCLDLKKRQALGIHFYMLNKSENISSILDEIS